MKLKIFWMLVQTGILRADLAADESMRAMGYALAIPEERIPADIGKAAQQFVKWWGTAQWLKNNPTQRDYFPMNATMPPEWVLEWLKHEQLPLPFDY